MKSRCGKACGQGIEIIEITPKEDANTCRRPEIALSMLHCLSGGDERSDRSAQDFFQQDTLTTNVSRYEFDSILNLSRWTDEFVHGADMIPGMVEGFTNYCNKHNTQFKNIQQIRFKQKTAGNLHYTILTKPSKTLQEDANIQGAFVDQNGEKYYFYGEENRRKKRPMTYDNDVSLDLLDIRNNRSFDNQEQGVKLVPYCEDMDDYTKAVEANKGFAWTIIADIINVIYKKRLGAPGLVMSYEDLEIKDGFSAEGLFNGSYIVKTDFIGVPRKTATGIGHKVEFELQDKSKSPVASGKATLREAQED